MSVLRQFAYMLRLELMMARSLVWMMVMVQFVLTLGLILGFGYFIPHLTRIQALWLTTGAASQTVVTTALVILPQKLARSEERRVGKECRL